VRGDGKWGGGAMEGEGERDGKGRGTEEEGTRGGGCKGEVSGGMRIT